MDSYHGEKKASLKERHQMLRRRFTMEIWSDLSVPVSWECCRSIPGILGTEWTGRGARGCRVQGRGWVIYNSVDTKLSLTTRKPSGINIMWIIFMPCITCPGSLGKSIVIGKVSQRRLNCTKWSPPPQFSSSDAAIVQGPEWSWGGNRMR